MAQIVKLRRSSVSGQKPTNSNLQLGELALNTTDGKVFMAVSGSGGPSVQELVSTNTVNTGSIHITNNVTSSFFTGSFIGDASNLYNFNVPISGVTDLVTVSGSIDSRLDALETLNHSYTGSLSGSINGVGLFDYFTFNTSSAPTTAPSYSMWANTTDKTVNLQMGNNATLQLGQEMYYPPVVNKSGADLNDGDLVMINPAGVAQGNRISVVKAIGNGTYPADYIVGVLTEDVPNNQEGLATWFGYVRNISKLHVEPAGETWVEGDILYPHPTIAGKMTRNTPVAPNLKSTIALVTTINGNNITLLVRPNLSNGISGQHDVNIVSGVTTGDLLVRSGSVWTNSKGLHGDYSVTGSLIITQNLTVLGSSSISYVTSSQLHVATSIISVNVYEPAERFGGLQVYDSGSSNSTASLLWDSLNNKWIYQNASGSSYSGGMLLSGPRNSGSLGDEVGLISGRIPKSVGGDHLDNSIITESNGVITIAGTLEAISFTGSIDFSNVENIPTLVSGSEQVVADFTFTTDTITNTDVNIVATSGDIILNADGGVYIGSSGGGNSIVTSGYFDLILGDTGRINSGTGHSVTDNIDGVINSLNSYTSSTNIRLDSIEGVTGSYATTGSNIFNGNQSVTGSFNVTGPVNIGENPIYGDINNPEVLHVYNSGSYNGIVALGNIDNFYQTYIANINSGNTASTDLIIGADNVTDNTHYLDLGINSSTYNAGYVGFENDSYLYAASDDLYIGTIGLSNGHSDVHIFTSNSWANPQLTVSGSGQIGFNSPIITDGYQYEFSGSIKALHNLSVGGSVSASYFTGNHIGDGSGLYNIPASGVTGLELNKIVNGSVSASISNGALRVNSDVFVDGVLTARELHTELVTSSVLYESGSTKFGNSLDDTHTFSGSILVHTLLETNRISPVNGSDVTIESSNLKVPNGGIYTDFNIESKGRVSATSISGNTITGSLISGSFIGDATNLINVPFHISGSNISGTTLDKTFTKLQFDDSTGLNVDETEPGTAFISIGSHFKDIFVSGSPILSATGSDAFEIIGLGGIHISSSTVDTNGNGYVKELTFDLTNFSSSIKDQFDIITGSISAGAAGSEGRTSKLSQTTASTTWSFTHNLGEQFPAIQVYDANNSVIIPGRIEAITSNRLDVFFPTAQSGTVTATVGGGLPGISGSYNGYVLTTDGTSAKWKGGFATTGSNVFTGAQTINNAKLDAKCVLLSSNATVFNLSSFDGANIDYVIKSGSNMRGGNIMAVWDGQYSKFTETTTSELGNTSNVTFTVTGTGQFNVNISSGTWTIESLYRALGCS